VLFADVPIAARIDRAEASLCAALAAGRSGEAMGVGWSHA
jgi:hypothetical protein